MDTLRSDVRAALSSRLDVPMITLWARGSTSEQFTGRQLLSKGSQTLDLWERCLGPGKHRLIVALPPGEAFLVSLISALLGGFTIVPVAPPRPSDIPDRLLRMARTCDATAILCTAKNRAAVEAQLRDETGAVAYPVLAVDDPQPVTARSPDETAIPYPIIQHTSGSTRFPKSLGITAAQVRENCGLIQSQWGMDAETVVVNWLPHYHDMGLMGCILYPLLSGAHSVQMSPFDMIRRPLSWLKAISAFKATISGGPTFAYRECLNRIDPTECSDLDLSSWKNAFCGGEPIPAGLLERFQRRFAAHGLAPGAVFACYGMAEVTLFAAGQAGHAPRESDLPEGWSATEACLLSPAIRTNIRIADPGTGLKQPDRTPGEIWLGGPSVCDGYLKQPEENRNSFRIDEAGRRWLRTGDLGGIAGRHLYITGRSKDTVIVNGRNIAAAEIEWIAAQSHDDLNPSGAAAIAHHGAGEGHAHLFIEIQTGAAPIEDPEHVAAHIRSSVTGHCGVVLDRVRILPRGALPRTSSGKIKRQAVLEKFKTERSRGPATPLHLKREPQA